MDLALPEVPGRAQGGEVSDFGAGFLIGLFLGGPLFVVIGVFAGFVRTEK